MSYQLTVLYHQPDDRAAFDAHYASVHAPLASSISGLRSYSATWPAAGRDGSLPAEHVVAVLVFDDEAAFGAAMGSPEGQAAGADIGTFATGGVTMLTGEVTTYV